MEASVVIGANYGDEGKGLITDYLSALDNASTLVIRFNGGAQAGHTVQRPNGLRHVFSHFGSGTFAGVPTYLSEFFIANPILFVEELEKLRACGYLTKVTIHPDAIVTTPYDMYINQVCENFRGKQRHGSCGVGIHETIERNLHEKFQLSVKDLLNFATVRQRLLAIREEWVALRVSQLISQPLSQEQKKIIFSDAIFEHFLTDIQAFLDYCDVADYHHLAQWNRLIFEGAQGLLLDQDHEYFPHVTRSNTGLKNVAAIARRNNITHLDIHYVTRCYLTRHGAGPLPHEHPVCPCPDFKDETNLPHEFQGSLRFAPLDIEALRLAIAADLNKLTETTSKKITLAMTCLDQFTKKITVVENERNFVELTKNEFIDYCIDNTEFDSHIFSYGPTREDIMAQLIHAST